MEGKSLCVSLRGTELKRCAASEADEESESWEEHVDAWQAGKHLYVFVHLCVDMYLRVCLWVLTVFTADGLVFKERRHQAWCELN